MNSIDMLCQFLHINNFQRTLLSCTLKRSLLAIMDTEGKNHMLQKFIRHFKQISHLIVTVLKRMVYFYFPKL